MASIDTLRACLFSFARIVMIFHTLCVCKNHTMKPSVNEYAACIQNSLSKNSHNESVPPCLHIDSNLIKKRYKIYLIEKNILYLIFI